MNKAILIGRLTKDPELKTTGSGVSVASFTLAVNRRFKNADGNYDADFISCVAWRQSAEYLSKNYIKGDMVGISGSIQTRSYDKDGTKVYITEVVADEIHYVGGIKPADNPSTADAVPLRNPPTVYDGPPSFRQGGLCKGGSAPSEDMGFDGLPMPEDDDLPY